MKLLSEDLQRMILGRAGVLKLINNIGWLSVDRILRVGLNMFVAVWIARYLGPERFGKMSFVLAMISLFSLAANLGLKELAVRELVRKPNDAQIILGTIAVLQLIGGAMAYAGLIWVVTALRPDDKLSLTLSMVAGLVLLAQFSETAIIWFESQVLSKYVVAVQSAGFILFVGVKILLIYSGASLVSFAWAATGEAVLVATWLLAVFDRKGVKLGLLRFSFSRTQELIRQAWPLLLSAAVLVVQARIDQIMLAELVGDSAVAVYSIALRIIEAAAIGTVILRSTFQPSIYRSREESSGAYRKKLAAFYKLNMLVAVIIAVPLAVLARPMVATLLGNEYLPAAPILALMSVRLVLAHMGVPRSVYLVAEGLFLHSALTMVVGTTVNVALNFLLIPSLGGIGATIASLISFTVSIVAVDLCFPSTRSNALLMLRCSLTFGSLFRRKSWVL